MPKKAGPATAIGILAAGAGALILGVGGGGGPMEAGPLGFEDAEGVVHEVQVVNRAARSPGGNLVRVVGVEISSEDAVTDDPTLGRVVEVGSPGSGICHVMLDAPEKTNPDKDASDFIPDIPALEDVFGKTAWPVKIPGSCVGGKCIWSTLIEGDACLVAADDPSYIGSTMNEFINLSQEQQARFLKTRAAVDGGILYVPVGDPRAIVGADVVVPHGWAGRRDLNYVNSVGGEPAYRYEPSIIEPDGGIQPIDGSPIRDAGAVVIP